MTLFLKFNVGLFLISISLAKTVEISQSRCSTAPGGRPPTICAPWPIAMSSIVADSTKMRTVNMLTRTLVKKRMPESISRQTMRTMDRAPLRTDCASGQRGAVSAGRGGGGDDGRAEAWTAVPLRADALDGARQVVAAPEQPLAAEQSNRRGVQRALRVRQEAAAQPGRASWTARPD